jgi:23S rRNA pseudouridine1911/1915/1917 synthase
VGNKLNIVFEDNHLLIVNKPGGIPVQPDPSKDESLLETCINYVRTTYNKPGNVFCEVTHRIDRPVSGLVIFAKTSKALARVNEMFKEKKIKKTYWALVGKRPDEVSGHLIHWLVRNSTKNITIAYKSEAKGSQLAELYYDLLQENNPYYLLEVKPITGRTHQIRCQLSVMGTPIVGDLKYRYRTALPDRTIALHARQLEFEHPVTKESMTIKAIPPDTEWWKNFGWID